MLYIIIVCTYDIALNCHRQRNDVLLFRRQLFESIRKKDERLMSKLKVVCGDVSMDELGVTPEMRQTLIANVSVVFHGAATLNLDASLSEAINMNTAGTLRTLEFCSAMNGLEVGTGHDRRSQNDGRTDCYARGLGWLRICEIPLSNIQMFNPTASAPTVRCTVIT